jgi:RHH-type proline utilization regulon transcriptional repressor/proline dehydrogenase/delta 1-pyrroline-5-carboxylate dehydrogenase
MSNAAISYSDMPTPASSLESAPLESKTSNAALESAVLKFGRQIFSTIDRKPSIDRKYLVNRIMEWSMRQPDFKANMFRLVDVLPVLRSQGSVAEHVREYLAPPAKKMNGFMGWGLRATSGAVTSRVAALFVRSSVREMASMFIAGEDPKAALKNLRRLRKNNLAFTVDLLGEFSVSEREADVYVQRYSEILDILGAALPEWPESQPIVTGHPGERSPVCISVKLTALYSQCGPLNFDRSVEVLSFKLSQIVRKAQQINALLYVDAEDSANNPIIYAAFKQVFGSAEFRNFPHPGIVLQAYSRESPKILEDLLAFAKQRGTPIAVRLVKGAYWDHETVISGQTNLASPLFSKKESSDANYEALSKVLIDNHEVCLPAFGSHNVRSLSHACCYAKQRGVSNKSFELQMLYGMAEPIAKAFQESGYLVRLYVPIGNMIVGMGYLVRRLLENTSNESFLKHTFFDAQEVDHLLKAPVMRE